MILHAWPNFVFGQNFTKFQPEKYDFDLDKGFFMKKMTQMCQILKKKRIQITRFLS